MTTVTRPVPGRLAMVSLVAWLMVWMVTMWLHLTPHLGPAGAAKLLAWKGEGTHPFGIDPSGT